jgi:hypothetical protein
MNNIGKPPEPNREVVERAIAEVLGIAQRQGITPADFVRMLDSGLRMSDFLTAVDLGWVVQNQRTRELPQIRVGLWVWVLGNQEDILGGCLTGSASVELVDEPKVFL